MAGDGRSSPRWGLCPWFEDLGRQLVHPDDYASLSALSPYGKVFLCDGMEGDFMILHYGKTSVRVAPSLFKEVPAPLFAIGDQVMTHRGETGIVREIHWHHKRRESFYLLLLAGKVASRRFWGNELAQQDESARDD